MSVEHAELPPQLSLPEARRHEVSESRIHQVEFAVSADGDAIYDAQDIGLPNEQQYQVLAEVKLGSSEDTGNLAVIRQRGSAKDSFMIAELAPDADKPGSMKVTGNVFELQDGYSLYLGRQPLAGTNTREGTAFVDSLRLNDDQGISRQHGSIYLERGKIVIGDTSSNGTRLRAQGSTDAVPSHEFKHTASAEEHARLMGHLYETVEGKRFGGRIPIGRDTTIDGGDAYVDIRSWVAGGEAIVVDSKKYPTEFQKMIGDYNTAHAELVRQGMGGEEAKLKAIFDTVSNTMEYDMDYVNNMEDFARSPASRAGNQRKVTLNSYLKDGKGVCRHMALAVAWLGGELARHGVVSGSMTAEVNQRSKDNAAHEWARYTATDGTVYILDPAQKYFGTLAESLNRERTWEYFRPGEKLKYEMLHKDELARGGDIAVSGIGKLFRRKRT